MKVSPARWRPLFTHPPRSSAAIPGEQTTRCDHNLPLHVVTAMSQDANVEIESDFLRRYQSLVGALLYCSGNTRPDVAFAVGMLCRAMSKPTPELFQDGLRVLSYLHRTRHIGLRYQSDGKHLRGQGRSPHGRPAGARSRCSAPDCRVSALARSLGVQGEAPHEGQVKDHLPHRCRRSAPVHEHGSELGGLVGI